MVWMRASVPFFVGGFLLATGGTVALGQAVQIAAGPFVTHVEMDRAIFRYFLAGMVPVLAGVWIIYSALQRSRNEKTESEHRAMRESVAANAAQIADIVRLFKEHHEDEGAHPAGSAARIDPINEKLESLLEGQHSLGLKLERLYSEHRIIRKTELCMMNAVNLAQRDPTLSPEPRRTTDPEDANFTNLRGKKTVEKEAREEDFEDPAALPEEAEP